MFTIGEYKGNVTITLKNNPEDPYGFTFGLTKAKLVVEHINDIKKFYEENKDKPRKPAE